MERKICPICGSGTLTSTTVWKCCKCSAKNVDVPVVESTPPDTPLYEAYEEPMALTIDEEEDGEIK